MYELNWKSSEFETKLKCLGYMSSFFSLSVLRRELVFLHYQELTTLIVFSKLEDELVLDYAITVQSEATVTKITGNNDYVLMYDVNHDLHCLQITVRTDTVILSSNNACTVLKRDSLLSWKKISHLKNCLAVIGVTDNFAFLYENVSLHSLIVPSSTIRSGFTPYVINAINESHSGRCVFLVKIDGEIAGVISRKWFGDYNSPYSDVMLIIQQDCIMFSKYKNTSQIFSKRFSVSFYSESVIAAMTFDNIGVLLIACTNGHIVRMKFHDSSQYIHISNFWLAHKICTITGYELNGEVYLLWSDLLNFRVSKLANSENELIDLEHQTKNLNGVRHLIRIGDYILAFSIHAYFYKAKIGKLCCKSEKLSDWQILDKIHEVARRLETFNENIARKEDLIRAMEFSRNQTGANVMVTLRSNFITMENKTEYVFKKKIWKIGLKMKNFSRKVIEVRNLENDFVPDAQINLTLCRMCSTLMTVSLICDIVPDAVSVINLEVRADRSYVSTKDLHIELENCLEVG